MGRIDRPLCTHRRGTWVGLLAVLTLAALPLLAASAFGARAAPGLQPVSYLPLIMGPPYYRIAFVSQREGNAKIYLINADGSNQTSLADGVNPAWSPDGRRIAFDGVDVINADGSNQTNLTTDPADDTNPVWSPTING